jgi:hypothetical protein
MVVVVEALAELLDTSCLLNNHIPTRQPLYYWLIILNLLTWLRAQSLLTLAA